MNPFMVQFLVVNFSMQAESDTSVTLGSTVWMGGGPRPYDPPVKLLATFIFGGMEEFHYYF